MEYVGGATARVRPYLIAYEREMETARREELRQRRVLVIATHGWEITA